MDRGWYGATCLERRRVLLLSVVAAAWEGQDQNALIPCTSPESVFLLRLVFLRCGNLILYCEMTMGKKLVGSPIFLIKNFAS